MPISDYMREVRSRVGTMTLAVPSVTVLVRDEDDRVLLVKHAINGKWGTPGGGIEPLESPADAALRETWEETGLLVSLTRLVGVYGGPEFQFTYPNGDGVAYTMIVFEARREGGGPRPDHDETTEVRFFERSEIEHGDWSAGMRRVLADLYADSPVACFPTSDWTPGESGG